LNKTRVTQAINEQINAELYSAYLYLSMAAYFEAQTLPGFAQWMKEQASEEVTHAMKFFAYLAETGARPQLEAIDRPPAQYSSPIDVFEQTLQHEEEVTRSIHALYTLAIEEKDYPAQVMLQWFISEQVEEEATATEILEALRRIGDKGHALIALDRELGRRGAA